MPLVAVVLLISTLLQAGSSLHLSPSSSSPSAATGGAETASVVFEPNGREDGSSAPSTRWVAPHTETSFWSGSDQNAECVGLAHLWEPLQVVGESQDYRVPIWDPSTRRRAWVDAQAVGPVDPSLVGTAYLPPIGRPATWAGAARITMYTCVELGGCAPTASGPWPEPGMVAVDPAVIPLGSTVWVQGLGTFVATDTGSLVRGAHLDVFNTNYQEAVSWGIQERTVLAFAPRR
jgi:3D (Asp-Asp-Asp) domain-containing protein